MTAGLGARLFVQHLLRLDVPASKIEAASGLKLALLQSPDARVPIDAVAKLVRFAYYVTQDDALALKLLPPREDHPPKALIGHIIVNCDSILQGFEHWCRYIRLDTKHIRLAVESDARYTTLTGYNFSNVQARWINELFLSLALFYCRMLGNHDVRPIKAEFAHHTPNYVNEYRGYIDGFIAFDALNTRFTFLTEAVSKANPKADPYLRNTLVAYADLLLGQLSEHNLTESVELEIRKRLDSKSVKISDLAGAFSMGASTFSRRLASEGTTYSDLLEKVRKELALVYLERAFTPQEVSNLLGYKQQTSFHHSFKRWYGVSPLKFRLPTA